MRRLFWAIGSGFVLLAGLCFMCCDNSSAPHDPASLRELSFLAGRQLEKERHVLLMHVDGFQRQIFQAMLANGQIPHFQFLAENGATHYDVSTVDKSETMKSFRRS